MQALRVTVFRARKLRRVPGTRPRDPKFVVVRVCGCDNRVPEQCSADAPGKGRGAEWQDGGAGLMLQIEQSVASAPKFELEIEVRSRPGSEESVVVGSARLDGGALDHTGRQWVELAEHEGTNAGRLELEVAWQAAKKMSGTAASDASYGDASFDSIDATPTPARPAIKSQPVQLSMSASVSQYSSFEQSTEPLKADVLLEQESGVTSFPTSSTSAQDEDVALDETVASALTSEADMAAQITSFTEEVRANQVFEPPKKGMMLKHDDRNGVSLSHEAGVETVLSETAPSTYEDEVFEDADAEMLVQDREGCVRQLPAESEYRAEQHPIAGVPAVVGTGKGAPARSLCVTVFQARSLRRVRGHPWDPKFALLRLPYTSTGGQVEQRTADVSGKGTKAVWPGGAELVLTMKHGDSLTANFEAVVEVRCRPSSTAAELCAAETDTVLIGSARLRHGEHGSLDRSDTHWVVLETNNGDEAGRVEIAVRWADGTSPRAPPKVEQVDDEAALASDSTQSSQPWPQVSPPPPLPTMESVPQQSAQPPGTATPESRSSPIPETTTEIAVQKPPSAASPACRPAARLDDPSSAQAEITPVLPPTRFRAHSVSAIEDSSHDEEAVEEVLRCVDWRALLRDQAAAGHSQPMVDWAANVTGGAARPNAAGYCASGPLVGAKLGRGNRPPAFSFGRARRTERRFMPKNEVEQLLQRRRKKQGATGLIPCATERAGPESVQHGTIGDDGALSRYPKVSSASFGRMQAHRFAGGPLADKAQSKSKRTLEAWRRRLPWAKDAPRLPTVRHADPSLHTAPTIVPASDDTCFARVRAPTESYPLSTVRTCKPARFAKSARFANDSVPVRLRAAVRAAAKDRVRRARGGSSAASKAVPKPASYAPHATLVEGELVVTVEHCHNCEQAHGMTTQHCSARYLKAANAMTDVVEQECVRQGKALVRVLLIPAPLEVGKGRLGALEVQATIMRSDGVPHSVVLHSKLATGRWPSREIVTQRLRQFLEQFPE